MGSLEDALCGGYVLYNKVCSRIGSQDCHWQPPPALRPHSYQLGLSTCANEAHFLERRHCNSSIQGSQEALSIAVVLKQDRCVKALACHFFTTSP